MMDGEQNIDNLEMLETQLIERQKQERQALATKVSDTLQYLNVSVDRLPKHCHELLCKKATLQNQLYTKDPKSIPLLHTKSTLALLEQEYELLTLKQQNRKLQIEIERNSNVLEHLRNELENSRRLLGSQSLNSENVDESVRQMKQKLDYYEQIYEKAKAKCNKLQVPESIQPIPLMELSERLVALQTEEIRLKQRAQDILLAREAMQRLGIMAGRM